MSATEYTVTVEKVAEAWARMDGNEAMFLHGRYYGDDREGRYQGYMADAEALLDAARDL